MTLEQLIKICKPVDISGDEPYAIHSLQQDSRLVKEDDVFIAVKGLSVDGHKFIDDAIFRGASVIICELPFYTEDKGVTVIEVEETRPLLGKLAQAFHGNPAEQLTTIAVTGTNGKTTVTTLVWQVLQILGQKTGLLGTIGKYYGEEKAESKLTTADPIELAADLKKMVDAGCKTVVTEVSSHALEQERTTGIKWDVAAFTNLSHDHLDYHQNMESYAAAKKKLFDTLEETAWAIVNFDDPHGSDMAKDCKAKILDFSFNSNTSIRCELLHSNETGSALTVDDIEIETPLVGTFNAYNVTEAFLSCTALGYDAGAVARALKECTGATGRLEKVSADVESAQSPTVFVDYAHTPNALENVASTLKGIKSEDQPLIIIFGCGGDRDKKKRPEMAKVAETYADRIVVTSDNPRSEDPESIIQEIETGFSKKGSWVSIASREKAIKTTITQSPDNAIILIAGKGHETYQEIKGKRIHFDDREIAAEALKNIKRPKKQGGAD